MRLKQTGIFEGRVQVVYSYGRYGWTRGGGKTWHGGIDLVALDDKTIRVPYYKGKKITGKVTRARIVYNHSDKTWEWGWYVCVQLDDNQTPDTVNFLYFCHCSKLLVHAGQKVSSGDALAVMGQTGNAANGYDHCHLEARATATGTGVDPTEYAGCANAVGIYGTAGEDTPAEKPAASTGKLQVITVGPVSQGDADAILAVCQQRGLTEAGLYKSEWV